MSLPTQYPTSSEEEGPSSSELVIRARAGDEMAFENLYKRFNNQICTYLGHMVGDDGIGCELTQETFLKAWKALPGLRNTSAFVGWLYRIATNLALDHQRRTRHIHWVYFSKEAENIEKLSIEDSSELIEAEENLKAALACIPSEYRACLILYHIQGVSKHRIAEILAIKESSVTTYISIGLKKLRMLLANEDIRSRRISQDL